MCLLFLVAGQHELFRGSATLHLAWLPKADPQQPFGVTSNEHDSALKIHISCLAKMHIADAPDGAPDFAERCGRYAETTSLV